MKFTADGIRTTNGVRVEDAADHSWHHHYEDGQDLQKASKNGTCLGLNVVLSSQGTLNNHLEVKKRCKRYQRWKRHLAQAVGCLTLSKTGAEHTL